MGEVVQLDSRRDKRPRENSLVLLVVLVFVGYVAFLSVVVAILKLILGG